MNTPQQQPASRRLPWRRYPLQWALAAVIVLAILPVTVTLAWRTALDLRAERERVQAELARSAGTLAQAVDGELASSIEALAVLSQSEIFQQGRVAAMGRLLQGRPRRDWDSVFLLDRDGSVVLDTSPPRSAPSAQGLRALHAQALRTRGAIVGPLPLAAPGTRPGSAIALPLIQNGAVRYVLGARLADSQWQRLVAGASRPEGARAVLVDGARVMGDSGAADKDERGGRAEAYQASARVAASGWLAQVSRPAAPIDAARRRTMALALAWDGGSLMLGVLLAAVVARRIGRRAVCGGSGAV